MNRFLSSLLFSGALLVSTAGFSGCAMISNAPAKTDSKNPTPTDLDGDGVKNIDDNDIDGDGIINPKDPDIDNDGILNTQDSDIDGDLILNSSDIDIDGDGIINSEDLDIDGDLILNGLDTDADGNDVADSTETDHTKGTEGPRNDDKDINIDGSSTGQNGVVVVIDRSVKVPLHSIVTPGVLQGTDTIDLVSIRSEANDQNVDLKNITISNIRVQADSASLAFVNAHKDLKIKLVVSQTNLTTSVSSIVANSPGAGDFFPMLTLGSFASGVELNAGLYAGAGFESFVSCLSDTTIPNVGVTAVLTLPEGITLPTSFGVQVIIEVQGKAQI